MLKIIEKITNSPDETIEFGKKILNLIPKETKILFLKGEMGSGKTTIAKGIVNSLGINTEVKSPTFGYKREYNGLIHYDFFLIKNKRSNDLLSLITEDENENFILIEWGNGLPKIKCASALIEIKRISNNERKIIIKK